VIEDICKSRILPKQLLVEFHHRFPGVGVKKTKNAITLLRSMGYSLASVAPSNLEYGFIRKGVT
jgi:hypothetical protein